MSARLAFVAVLSACSMANVFAVPDRNILVPDTSVNRPEDRGLRVHTNHLVYVGPPQITHEDPFNPIPMAMHGPAFLGSTPQGYFPADIRAAYNVSGSGGGAIAIVDAYHYASSLNDFNVFAGQFKLPTETSTNPLSTANTVFQVVYASGVQPKADGGWGQEAALDIEWAHAMAPGAKIYLVEAASASYADMFKAVNVAKSLYGVKQVSLSWGGSEFSTQTTYDGNMVQDGVVFFASSGDSGGSKGFPATSPNAVGVGGTSLKKSGSSWVETVWSGSGCGLSTIEPRPSYQSGVSAVVGNVRGSADIALVADPYTGCAVYDSTAYRGQSGWLVFGGTSLSAPCCAGIANAKGTNRASSAVELAWIYGALGDPLAFRDITSGSAGSYSAKSGYDLPTGVGSPINGL